MANLRVVLNVSPVGPWSQMLTADPVWFALQISAVTDAEPSEADRATVANSLMPWTLLAGDGWEKRKTIGSISLNCWIASGADIISLPTEVNALDPAPNDFARSTLCPAIATQFSKPKVLSNYVFANNPGAVDPNGPTNPTSQLLGTALHSISTLPGPIASVLGATVYFSLSRSQLVSTTPGFARLVVVPSVLFNASIDPSIPCSLSPPPPGKPYATYADPGGHMSVYTFEYDGGSMTACGPGFDLSLLAAPPTTPLDTTSYWMRVAPTVLPVIDLDAVLANAIDPFLELTDSSAVDAISKLTISLNGTTRQIYPAEAQILRAQWIVNSAVEALGEDYTNEFFYYVLSLEGEDDPRTKATAAWNSIVHKPPANGDAEHNLTWLRGALKCPEMSDVNTVAKSATSATLTRAALAFLVRPTTPGDPSLGALAWERSRLTKGDQVPIRAAAATQSTTPPREAMAKAAEKLFLARWAKRLMPISWTPAFLPAGAVLGDAESMLGPLSHDRGQLLNSAPGASSGVKRVALPEAGWSITYGNRDTSIAHASDFRYGDFDVFRHFNGALLWVKRSSAAPDGTETYDAWRLQTGGLMASNGQLSDPYPIPIRLGFDRDLHRAEIQFEGFPLTAKHPLSGAYEEIRDLPVDDSDVFDMLLHTQAAGPAAPFGICPLRYGDWYRAAVSLVDEAGGLATEVANPTRPFELQVDAAKLEKLFADQPTLCSARQRYLRMVPIGDINITAAVGDWPIVPTGVFLRAEEQWQAWLKLNHPNLEQSSKPATPKLLLHGPDIGGLKTNYTADTYVIRLLPPSIDEHTLMRWATPSVGTAPADAARQRSDLRSALSRIFSTRKQNALGKGDQYAALASDPAVTAIGLRIYVDASPVVSTELILPVRESIDPYLATPLNITFTSGSIGSASLAYDPTGVVCVGANVIVAPGTFVYVMAHPLVQTTLVAVDAASQEAPSTRIDISSIESFGSYVAFPGLPLLAENISKAMPGEAVLYAAASIDVDPADGTARLFLDAAQMGHSAAYMDRLVLQRQILAWRNLPWVSEDILNAVPAQRDRCICSGLPEQLGDTSSSDYEKLISLVEPILSIDGGFVQHTPINARWPRNSSGKIDCNVSLISDSHDKDSRALYCRYFLTIQSRYAPLLEKPTVSFPVGLYRRGLVPYRGRVPKPPLVLAVIPLTQSLLIPGAIPPISPTATPILVLLDECWFREYGPGERLLAKLDREPNDPGEDIFISPDGSWVTRENPRPYRIGPLPDHFTAKPGAGEARYLLGRATAEQDNANPKLLPVYGPFGFSFDESTDQSLASSTAFVVSPPNESRPHFALTLRFQRKLEFPSRGDESEWSGPYSVHLLPDSNHLASGTSGELQLSQDGTTALLMGDIECWLDPVAGSASSTMTSSPWHEESKDSEGNLLNSEGGANYRYFILFTDVIEMNGGTEIPIGVSQIVLFKPDSVQRDSALFEPFYRIKFSAGEALGLRPLFTVGPRIRRARILEVWLNGRSNQASNPMDRATSSREFWTNLLPTDKDVEALGQLRRVSPPISVVFV